MYEDAGALERVEAAQRTFITQVFGWMCFALLITAAVAAICASSTSFMKLMATSPALLWGVLIGELGLVFVISAAINSLSAAVATGLFILYAALNGVTLSFVLLAYTQQSVFATFAVTSGTFGVMSLYGYVTKTDLTRIGNLCLMGLFGLIIATVVNLFVGSAAMGWWITYAGILIFVGLTAYHTQKIKDRAAGMTEGTELAQKAAIYGALDLYLDFINLFFYILRVLGKRRG